MNIFKAKGQVGCLSCWKCSQLGWFKPLPKGARPCDSQRPGQLCLPRPLTRRPPAVSGPPGEAGSPRSCCWARAPTRTTTGSGGGRLLPALHPGRAPTTRLRGRGSAGRKDELDGGGGGGGARAPATPAVSSRLDLGGCARPCVCTRPRVRVHVPVCEPTRNTRGPGVDGSRLAPGSHHQRGRSKTPFVADDSCQLNKNSTSLFSWSG